MLSSRMRVDAGLERLRDLLERLGLDLDRQRDRAAQSANRLLDAAGEAQVVVLDQHGVVQAEAVVRRRRRSGTAYFSRAAQAGRRLARVEDGRARALDRVDVTPA